MIAAVVELASPTLAVATVHNLSHIVHNPNLSMHTHTEFHSVSDLREDIGQTMMCLFETVKTVVVRWKSFDWKSTRDEQPLRRELVEKMVKMFERAEWAELR